MGDKNLPWANKDLGQHFLRDTEIIQRICNDRCDSADVIFEVGPGPGILTKLLSAHNLPFYVFEKDNRFKEFLVDYVSDENIVMGDALKLDLYDFIRERELTDKSIWLVSNLPYNVSVPLLIMFTQCHHISEMTLMFQREVGDKIVNFDTKKKKAMNSLMSLCQTYFECSVLTQVPPEAFTPPPKVDSVVISFTRKDNPEIPLSEFRRFESFLRKLFAQRRKQIGSVLKQFYDKDKLMIALDKANLDRTLRAETFNLDQVLLLYRLIEEQ